jgi:hypothetical protein
MGKNLDFFLDIFPKQGKKLVLAKQYCGSVTCWYGSGCGSGRPKNIRIQIRMRIRIRNTVAKITFFRLKKCSECLIFHAKLLCIYITVEMNKFWTYCDFFCKTGIPLLR